MDQKLIRIVHREHYFGYSITASISRFGGLVVLVTDDEMEEGFCVWQGNNIINARNWVDESIKSKVDSTFPLGLH
jgi:hypothetical protein